MVMVELYKVCYYANRSKMGPFSYSLSRYSVSVILLICLKCRRRVVQLSFIVIPAHYQFISRKQALFNLFVGTLTLHYYVRAIKLVDVLFTYNLFSMPNCLIRVKNSRRKKLIIINYAFIVRNHFLSKYCSLNVFTFPTTFISGSRNKLRWR